MRKDEQQINQEWANNMLNEATDAMEEEEQQPITPESLSKFWLFAIPRGRG